MFLGVILYKVQFHLSKKATLALVEEPSILSNAQMALQYRQVKEHFSDDEGDLSLGVDDFLDEDDDDQISAELEMQGSHRRSSLNGSTCDSDGSQRQNLV